MVVLYNPVSSASKKPILPLALLALGAVLEGRSAYALADGNLDADPASRIRDLLARGDGPPILGITAMPGPQLRDAVPVARKIKEIRPETRIVWGGYFATQHAGTVMASDLADFAIRGHGELPFADLVRLLEGGNPDPADLARIPGLSWRKNAEIVHNPQPALPRVADLPAFPLHKIPVERYVRPTFLGARTLGHHSSYGCPYVCNFCAVTTMAEGRWNGQNAAQIAATVGAYRERWGVDAVEFYDNNFFVSEARCREFSDRTRDLGVSWWGEGRIDTLLRFKDETWRSMRDAGLRMIFMGAESGSAETLARMEKGGTLTPQMTLDLVGRMAKFGVVPELSFVLGSPPDPVADIEGTLAFVRKVKEKNPRTEIILYLYTPEPVDGALYEAAKAAGFRYPDTLEAWADPAWEDVIQRRSGALPWMDRGLAARLRGFEYVLNARFPTGTDSAITPSRRRLLKAVSSWRWASGSYRYPLELMAIQKWMRYRRPETSGF